MDEIKAALEELSNFADEISKAVLATYNPEEDHTVNKGNLIKHTVEYLERCAAFLKITLLNEEGRKLYANKSLLADRMILIIESYFPTTCLDCDENYQIKYNDSEPSVRCLFCLQGCHSCDKRQESLKALQKLPEQFLMGIAWFCKSCFTKNNSIGPNQLSSWSPECSLEKSDCEDYRRGKCEHGASQKKQVNGKTCQFKHRQKCIKWCRYGKSQRGGCTKGDNCSKFHPLICKFSLKKGYCTNPRCTYAHLIGTRNKQSAEDYFRHTDGQYPQIGNSSQQINARYEQPYVKRNFQSHGSSFRHTNSHFNNKQQGYQYNSAEYPPLLRENVTKKTQMYSTGTEKDAAFLSLVEIITGMEQKFSNQIAVMQNTLSMLTPQVQMFNQSQDLHHSNLDRNSPSMVQNQQQQLRFGQSQSQM